MNEAPPPGTHHARPVRVEPEGAAFLPPADPSPSLHPSADPPPAIHRGGGVEKEREGVRFKGEHFFVFLIYTFVLLA